jgi:hypothetical protein
MALSVNNNSAFSLFKSGMNKLSSENTEIQRFGLNHLEEACSALGSARISSPVVITSGKFGSNNKLYLMVLCHFGKSSEIKAKATTLGKILQNETVKNRSALTHDLKLCAKFLSTDEIADCMRTTTPQVSGSFSNRHEGFIKPLLTAMDWVTVDEGVSLGDALQQTGDGLAAWELVENRCVGESDESYKISASRERFNGVMKTPLRAESRLLLNRALSKQEGIELFKQLDGKTEGDLQFYISAIFNTVPEEDKKDLIEIMGKTKVSRSSSPVSSLEKGRETPESNDSGLGDDFVFPKPLLSAASLDNMLKKGLINQKQYRAGMTALGLKSD